MKNISLLLLCVLFYACAAQTKQKTLTMETFNVVEFKKNKVADEYIRLLEDGTRIIQFENSEEYVEKKIPPNGWFYTLKIFYKNGQLKSTGELFKKGDFKSGIWIECDSNGHKISEINYDRPYYLTVDSIFRILRQQEVPFSLDNLYNTIRRGPKGSSYTWIIKWKQYPDRIERMEIDDATGRIIKRDFQEFIEE